MKKLLCVIFLTGLSLFSKNAMSEDNLIAHVAGESPSKPFITEEELLNEIEVTQQKLDKLVSEGRLSASTALAVSGALATLAFGVFRIANFVHANSDDIWFNQWAWGGYYDDDGDLTTGRWQEGGQGISGILITSFLDSIFPALGIGGLMGYSNYEDEQLPSLSKTDAVHFGLKTFMTGLGLNLILSGSSLAASSKHFGAARTLIHAFVHGFTGYQMFTSILSARQQKQKDIFDLKTQLESSKRRLAQLRGEEV